MFNHAVQHFNAAWPTMGPYLLFFLAGGCAGVGIQLYREHRRDCGKHPARKL